MEKINNNDRRVQRTKRNLHSSLVKLMKMKKINKISVKELTELADVNRATFYAYYVDIFDMVAQLENEMIEEIKKVVTTGNDTNSGECTFFIKVFDIIKENEDLFSILLRNDGDCSFFEKFKKAIMDYKFSLEIDANSKTDHFVIPFVVSGLFGTIQQWLIEGMNVSSTEMGQFVLKMVLNER
ncbi:MAG TPA: TetR/AcrR family transcriptional regulator [Firmicutes bacterium]|jgi:AcrR family transcriptional regulator|nr:TetR/AcrR family transcriptional regulator [Bacillota bacterium]